MKSISIFSKFVFILVFPLLFSGCVSSDNKEFQKATTEGAVLVEDQVMKSAVGYLEVYKLQNGTYPQDFDSMQRLNEFDSQMFTEFLSYEKLDRGYRLDMKKGFDGSETIHVSYPEGFWKDTGLLKTNTTK